MSENIAVAKVHLYGNYAIFLWEYMAITKLASTDIVL